MSGSFWRQLYTMLFYLFLPFIYLRLLWRSRRLPAYRQRISERFGYFNIPDKFRQGIWIHAVSFGEVIVATPLIKMLQSRYPNIPIIVTCMTPTGSAQVIKIFGDTVFNIYAPYDLPKYINRFLNKINPKLLILIETELWPNWLYRLSQKKIPILLANGRLSEKSFKNYSRFSTITKAMMQSLSMVAVQSAPEAERFIRLGVAKEKLTITGNIKFDMTVPEGLLDQAKLLREQLGVHRIVWIAASTHQGEEEEILCAFEQIKKQHPSALLLLVPRHPDRFAQVTKLCQQKYKVVRRSEKKHCSDQDDVFLGDSMGEMLLFYAVSDIAFVGGSLIERGGHNTLEPALFALPIISGVYTFNFTEITRLLTQANGLILVNNITELTQAVNDFMAYPEKRVQYGQAANQVVEHNKGALDKHLAMISQLYGE
jgi:3-deoxy-D-manno-octulosonic-acid transferase